MKVTHFKLRAAVVAASACCTVSAQSNYAVTFSASANALQTFPGPTQSDPRFSSFEWIDQPQALVANARDETASVGLDRTSKAQILVNIGTLKTYSSASFPWAYLPTFQTLNEGYSNATAQGSFYDTLVVGGAGLPLGTPVSYPLDFNIQGTLQSLPISRPDYYGVVAQASVWFHDFGSSSFQVRFDWSSLTQANGTYSVTLDTAVGRRLSVYGSPLTFVGVDAQAVTAGTAEADFLSLGVLQGARFSFARPIATAVSPDRPNKAHAFLLGFGDYLRCRT